MPVYGGVKGWDVSTELQYLDQTATSSYIKDPTQCSTFIYIYRSHTVLDYNSIAGPLFIQAYSHVTRNKWRKTVYFGIVDDIAKFNDR